MCLRSADPAVPRFSINWTPPKSFTRVLGYEVSLLNFGWKQGLRYDGLAAGSTGHSLAIDAVRVIQLPPLIQYRVYAKDLGWLNWVNSGKVAGTLDQSHYLESLQFRFIGSGNPPVTLYGRAHIQDLGWQEVKELIVDGDFLGTTGQSKRLEAIQLWMVIPNSDLVIASLAPTSGAASSNQQSDSAKSAKERINNVANSTMLCGLSILGTVAACRVGIGLACTSALGTAVFSCTQAVEAIESFQGGLDPGTEEKDPNIGNEPDDVVGSDEDEDDEDEDLGS
jgi:hypothetical protein